MKIIRKDLEIHNDNGICVVSAFDTDDVLELNYLKYLFNEIEKMSEEKEEVKEETVEYISFEDLMKVDIRVCEVLEAERVPKTDKLLKLTITTGEDERISITNIGEFIEPETLVGKKIPFVLNLPPMKMRGVETTAMVFISSDSNGINIPNLDCEVGAAYLR